MKLNNKGFAISSIMYIILVLAVILISVTLALLSSRKMILDKLKNDVLDGVHYVCKSVTEETKTTGSVPIGEFNIGDEYICEVKPNVRYHFFVLSVEDNKVNLILDRNINNDGTLATSLITKENAVNGVFNAVAWEANGSTWTGPVAAMNYLHNATKYWTNIENIEMDYVDEGSTGDYGYASIKTVGTTTTITKRDTTVTATYENLKARLPKYSEVTSQDAGCTEDAISCKLWIANYLRRSGNLVSEGEKISTDISTYWLLSSFSENTWKAWMVSDRVSADISSHVGGYGVRPVITVSKMDIK